MRLKTHVLFPRSMWSCYLRTLIACIIGSTLVYNLIFSLKTESLIIWNANLTLRFHEYITQTFVTINVDEDLTNTNQLKPACVFPKLLLNNSDIMSFFMKYPKLNCSEEPDWLIIDNGVFTITSAAYSKHPDIHCDAYPIIKVTDFKTSELKPITDVKNGTNVSHDFYRVFCKSSDSSEYKNYLAGISPSPDALKRETAANSSGLDVDVIMLGLDSTSHLAWHRHLPLSTDYFLNVLNGTEMNGYNILGDGTPAAIMPILLGHIEEELHEARRGYNGASAVDDFPWIWNEFKKAGYVTTYVEDDARLGTFQYRLLGFNNQPTDHYFRYFCVAAEPNYWEFKEHCQGFRPRHSIVLDYVSQVMNAYPQKRKWIFSFQAQLSHEDNNNLSYMDEDLLRHLQKLHREKHLDNAILILLADHGARFTKVRSTAQGKQEERLPYFAFRFPEWFHEKYPEIIANVVANSDRLTTPFDVHETLKEILNFTGTGPADISKRGVSMFKKIPMERVCSSAHVEPHWCSCLQWKEEDPSSDIIIQAAAAVISTFNNYTKKYRDLCSMLSLGKVISATSMKVNDAVLKFKVSNDGGRGRLGSMNDKTQIATILYEVTFVTHPGSGRFEATVSYDILQKLFTLDSKDISRTNKYGNGPWCVEEKDPFLRPYCYCKDLLELRDVVGNQNSNESSWTSENIN